MSKKIIHVSMADKFLPPFIDFIQEKFSKENNTFYLYGDESVYGFLKDRGVFFFGKKESQVSYFRLLLEMYNADKIILHGLFNSKVIKTLFYHPWLLKKCYWSMWGGDLYGEDKRSKISNLYKKMVIKNMGFLITFIPRDVEYARDKFGAKGKYVENLGYLSNIFTPVYSLIEERKGSVNILLGNSADPANEHIEALVKLEKFKESNIKIYAPLSYGNQTYADQVIQYGKTIFEHKFVPLTEFMPYEKYLSFLQNIDIAIFNHKRQQAMGNTINLLGMGKVVYLREGTPQWEFFKSINIQVYDLENFNIHMSSRNNNKRIVGEFFSISKLEKQWGNLLNE